MNLPRGGVVLCPSCGTAASSSTVLIEYRRRDGSPARFGECGACREVIHL